MCGRYYIDSDTALEIEKIVRNLDKKLRDTTVFAARDVHPGDKAPVLVADRRGIDVDVKTWGYPGIEGTKLIFNARCETAWEKRMFREGLIYRRVVVPASWFYEWNKNKERNTFYIEEPSILFMAGIYNRYPDGDRFTILTTQANTSMKPVHDRMPLLLAQDELIPWLLDESQTSKLLSNIPCLLARKTDYEQMSLF